jgi:hypothetical protein
MSITSGEATVIPMHLTSLLMASGSEFTVAPSIQLVLGTVVTIAAFIVLFVLLIRLGRARRK